MHARKALIVQGGWDGHEPALVAARFKRILEEEGVHVTVADTLDVYKDAAYLQTLHLIVPVWTGGSLPYEDCKNISLAIAGGVGMAGNHGGMCDAFRENVEWQFITGANWVSHPGGIIPYTVEIVRNSASPIVDGLDDFQVTSEQYYLHVDPAIEVLATTRFPQAVYFHASNKAIDMPVVWTKKWGHGRVFYNALGHTDNVFGDAPQAELLMRRGMLWAMEGRDIALARGLDAAQYASDKKMY